MPKLAVILLLLPLLTQAAQPIRLATGEWPPYTGATLPHGGLAEHIITSAFAASGQSVSYLRLSWKRGLEMARQGKADGAILWSCRDQASQPDYLVSQPIIRSEVVLLRRVGRVLDLKHPDKARGFRLAYPDMYAYEGIPAYAQLLKASGIPPLILSSDQAGIQALLNDRIDAYPVDRQVGLYLLHQAAPTVWQDMVTQLAQPLSQHDLCVLLHRRHPDAGNWLAALNQGLAKLRSSGQIDRWQAELTATRHTAPPGHTSTGQ
ncbi:MAG: transporter substrate-binding domain-containing protein [Chitinimonas sp.]|nr:transporter substrate-binding domain-containing protein [Chitinimonas sp.]